MQRSPKLLRCIFCHFNPLQLKSQAKTVIFQKLPGSLACSYKVTENGVNSNVQRGRNRLMPLVDTVL